MMRNEDHEQNGINEPLIVQTPKYGVVISACGTATSRKSWKPGQHKVFTSVMIPWNSCPVGDPSLRFR